MLSRISGSLSRSEQEALRLEIAERGRQDLHFFAAVVCGVTCMSPTDALHGRVCSFLSDARWVRKWLEIFRGGLKSTLGNCWDLQAVVRDPSERRLIMSAVHDLSKMFLRDIKSIILSRTFRTIYPEIRPVKSLWNLREAAVTVPGMKHGGREATFGTGGLDVGLTGTHWSSIRWDDLVIDKNSET